MKVFVIRKPYFWVTRGIETICFDVFVGNSQDDQNRLFYNRIIQNVDAARDYAKRLKKRESAEVVFIDEIEIL